MVLPLLLRVSECATPAAHGGAPHYAPRRMVIGDQQQKLLAFHLVQLVEVEKANVLLLNPADFHFSCRVDRYGRPTLDGRLHGLVDAGPEAAEDAFVELLRQL